MRVISKRTLREFWQSHANAEQALTEWYTVAKQASWKTPSDIKREFASASFVGSNRVVFNIKGNTYRLIVAIHYNTGVMFVRFVGTHAEYDKIDAETV